MWQWWVSRSSRAVVILASPNTLDHSAKLRLVVITTLVCSYTVIYNHRITIKGIPEAAWDYVVNGKAALDWVMERQAVRTDKASGIVNDWATETMGNPKYPLELFQRVVTVSLETQKIVNSLPPLDI